ncbi:MAG: prepilin-type N-terminal cleavage/methylation domain-containing protein [Gemmataceae bacterium]
MTRLRPRRAGFTLMETMAVLAILLIIAAVTFPTFRGLKGNADQRAAADMVRGRIADARGLAMERGEPYRLAISADGTRIRLAPDTADFGSLPAADEPGAAVTCLESRLDHATAGLIADDAADAPAGDGTWVTVGTFLPDGTCREVGTVIAVSEGGYPPIRIQLRGVSGSARVLPNDSKYGGG